MKYQKLTALLGLSEILLNAGIFGQKKPFAKLEEDELQKIEDALANVTEAETQQALNDAKEEITALKTKVTELEGIILTEQQQNADMANAVEQALQHAGLEAQGNFVSNIAHLGEKCKEYGESKERHTFAENNGKDEVVDGYINGFIDPNDEHNQLLAELK